MKRLIPVLIAVFVFPDLALAYPGGTPGFITDVAPYCAACHSSVSADQFSGVPEPRVNAELVDNKHLAKIEAAKPDSPYGKLTPEQRAELIAGIRKIDAAAKVEVIVPSTVKAGTVIEVTVRATGGGGPVGGLALVDSNLRWQARPAPSAGWSVLDAPVVTGPDGKPQGDFTSRRAPGLSPGIAYVNITGIEADTAKGEYSQVSTTWRLKAPSEPGEYPLGALFLYGTEKGAPHGAVESIRGKQPVGTYTANAGRIKFSKILQVKVN